MEFMRLKSRSTALAFVSILGLATCSHKQDAGIELDAAQWRKDLQFLAATLPQKHVNAFHGITKEQFAQEVASIDAALQGVDSDKALVRMMRLVAMVGDGHTHLDLPRGWDRYPLDVDWFGNELRIVGADAAAVPLLGARVIAVDGVPVADIMTKLGELVPRGENAGRTRYDATALFTNPIVLHGIGVTPGAEVATFTVVMPKGDTVSRALYPRDINRAIAPQVAAVQPPLYMRYPSVTWWANVVPDGSAVYVAIRAYPPAGELERAAQALKESLSGSRVQRVVFDMRKNAANNYDRFRKVILPVLQDSAMDARQHDVFVVTGPGTSFAAMVNALDLRNRGAILIGEPTGARLNTYSDHGEFRLPESNLRVSYATKYNRLGADGDSAVLPDIPATRTWAQYVMGQDSALNLALSGAGRALRRATPPSSDSANAKK
jgi:hypothetical protein